MPLAPAARTMIDQLEATGGPPLWEMSVEDARVISGVMGAMDQPPEVAAVEDRVIPGPGGDLLVRIYTPEAPAPRPAIAFFHGGGFVICSIETHDGLARRLANAIGAVVVSVEYRLAPDVRCPESAEDCYAATVWTHEHAAELGADPDRLIVVGDSAGGNLAAVVTLMARERGAPPITSQVLVYPVIDAACDAPSYTENGEGYFLEATGMRWFWDHYLGPDGDGTHHHASPIHAEDHSALPPAVVITAEFDPLRDEGEAYAAALEAAGVPVVARRYDGMIHGFVSMPMVFPEADDAVAHIAEAVERSVSPR
ncbi:MAG TPA: alpha/beta hydrolase [Acidimicrobiia bacterium]|nr:alpha/beta hydrolase [Acidimicrobiia bacterium]